MSEVRSQCCGLSGLPLLVSQFGVVSTAIVVDSLIVNEGLYLFAVSSGCPR